MEKVVTFVRSLERREFIGTESRLNTAFELLRQIVYGAEADPAKRLDPRSTRCRACVCWPAGARRLPSATTNCAVIDPVWSPGERPPASRR